MAAVNTGIDFSVLQGQGFGPFPMRVCLEKVNEFVDATGGDRARWREAAPPGYLAAALFVVAPELLGQLVGYSVLHGEQTFRWASPLVMESDLMVSGEATKVRERSGTYFVTFELSVTSDGAEIAGGSSLFLVAPEVDAAHGLDVEVLHPSDRGSPGPGQRSASRGDLVRYAAATRDWNPIHWDNETARGAGLSGVVVHGLLQAAWALDAASDGLTGRSFESAKVRFRNPLPTARPVDVVVSAGDGSRLVSVEDAETQYLSARIQIAE